MECKLEDLKEKTIVSIKDGINLGFVDDVVIDVKIAKILSLVIYGKKRFFGILGREEDIIIPWDTIHVIGNDVILINFDCSSFSHNKQHKKKFLQNLFH